MCSRPAARIACVHGRHVVATQSTSTCSGWSLHIYRWIYGIEMVKRDRAGERHGRARNARLGWYIIYTQLRRRYAQTAAIGISRLKHFYYLPAEWLVYIFLYKLLLHTTGRAINKTRCFPFGSLLSSPMFDGGRERKKTRTAFARLLVRMSCLVFVCVAT